MKIVIIDSVTFHFRQDFDDLAMRTRVLGGLSLKLMKLAKRFSLAVSNAIYRNESFSTTFFYIVHTKWQAISQTFYL